MQSSYYKAFALLHKIMASELLCSLIMKQILVLCEALSLCTISVLLGIAYCVSQKPAPSTVQENGPTRHPFVDGMSPRNNTDLTTSCSAIGQVRSESSGSTAEDKSNS